MNHSKVAIVVSQIIEKIELILGGLWTFFFVFGFIACIFDDMEGRIPVAITMGVLAAFGVWVFLCGRKRKKMRLEFRKYVAHLSGNPTGSLDRIAAASGTSVDVVKKNIQFMLKKKFFPNAYLDEANQRLVLPSMTNRESAAAPVTHHAAAQGQAQEEVVYNTCNCPNCGGVNRIARGMVVECDFCGSPLQG